jgi:hypothetical protein
VLWIADPDSINCRSRADLDPDPYPFQPNCVQFLENFQYTVQNIENCDTYDVEVKDITRETSNAVNYLKKIWDFQHL